MSKKVYYCPKGHECQDRTALHISTNRGIYCLTCRDWRTCPVCGWIGTRYQITRYLSNTQAYRRGLRQHHNPLDGGVYGLCPACENGLVHGQGGWWLNEKSLLDAGGSVERDD